MNQQFLEITVIPFVKAFLDELKSFTKEKAENEHKSFETAFLEYFDKSDVNRRRLHLLTWDIVEKIKGKQDNLFPQLENEQATDLLVNLLHDKYKSYDSSYNFQQGFFLDEKGENHQRVRENIYLFSTLFNNEAVKLQGVSIRTCSGDQIENLEKLLKTVLGESRYKQVAPQVFLPNNKVYISNDLAYELESAFKLMVESKFEDATAIEIAFDRQTLSLDAVVKLPKQDIQILSTNGAQKITVVKLDSPETTDEAEEPNQPVVEVKNIIGETVPLQVSKPNLAQNDAEEETYVVGQNGLSTRERGRIFEFKENEPSGTAESVSHVGPISGYTKEEHKLPLQPRPRRFKTQQVSGSESQFAIHRYGKLNQAQDYSVQQKATRRFKAKQTAQNDADTIKPGANQQQNNDQRSKQQGKKQKQIAQGRGLKRKSTIWKLVAASAGVSGVPVGFASIAYMATSPQTTDPTTNTIASVVGGAHNLLASFIGLFV